MKSGNIRNPAKILIIIIIDENYGALYEENR